MSLSKNNCAFSSSSLSEDSDNSLADVTYFPGSANDSRDTVYSNDEDNPPYPTAVNSQIYDNCFEEDSPDLESCTPVAKQNSFDLQPSTSTSNINNSPIILASPAMKGKKKRKQPENWKKNIVKKKRNSGEYYVSLKKIIRNKREIKPPCGESCRYKCSNKFSEEKRKEIFSSYWALGDIEKQRQFISKCMELVEPKYRYVRLGGKRAPRQYNNAFFLKIFDNSIRVCKLFFKNTLDINDRPIRTVIEKREKLANQVLQPDQRGKHGKHRKLDKNIANGIRAFIETIPKIESHYTRANTSKTFIEGSKTISSLYRDYVDVCKEKKTILHMYFVL